MKYSNEAAERLRKRLDMHCDRVAICEEGDHLLLIRSRPFSERWLTDTGHEFRCWSVKTKEAIPLVSLSSELLSMAEQLADEEAINRLVEAKEDRQIIER